MRPLLKVLVIVSAVLYPVIIYVTLSYFDASPRVLALVLVFVAIFYFIAHTDNARGELVKRVQFWGVIAAASVLAAVTFITENAGFVKFYPVSTNLFLLFSFFITLVRPPNIIFRFAQVQDKSISTSENKEYIESYCKKVTIVWIVFFICNGFIAALSAFLFSHFAWALYNGLISYILIGLVFLVELLVRRKKVKP